MTANDINPHAQRANEVQAAREAVIQAARLMLNNGDFMYDPKTGANTFEVPPHLARRLNEAFLEMDALQAEPPEGESAEPELPPRAARAEWRRLMGQVDHEGGC